MPSSAVPLGFTLHGSGHETGAESGGEGELHRFADGAVDEFNGADWNFVFGSIGDFEWAVANGVHIKDHLLGRRGEKRSSGHEERWKSQEAGKEMKHGGSLNRGGMCVNSRAVAGEWFSIAVAGKGD